MVNGKVVLAGISSFGKDCGNPEFPGIFARVSNQLEWILANSDAGQWQCT
jgi:secreted trypsin-like serine protease